MAQNLFVHEILYASVVIDYNFKSNKISPVTYHLCAFELFLSNSIAFSASAKPRYAKFKT